MKQANPLERMESVNYRAPKGTKDVLPSESYRWQYLESMIRKLAAKYGIQEARTPVIEHTELFLRGVGDTTDIVQKEMYTFEDKGGRSITLKPEGTAGIVRMFVEHSLCSELQPTKIYYLNSPVFRYERPQAGRLREHHQFGVEFFGAPEPTADAECISLVLEFLSAIGIRNLKVKLNSIGCPHCRPAYHKALHAYLAERYDGLCETCRSRFETNPLRILDCKVPSCQALLTDTPVITDFLCDSCRTHFETLRHYLDLMSVSYELDPKLVRGLDYYTKTVFEVVSEDMTPQIAICGGGRYDDLVRQLGGPDCAGIGFGLGMERLLMLMEETGTEIPSAPLYDLYIASAGTVSKDRVFELCWELRAKGLKADIDHVGRSLKAQMKYADRVKAVYIIVVGDDELASGNARIKNMRSGEETEISLDAESIASFILNGEKEK